MSRKAKTQRRRQQATNKLTLVRLLTYLPAVGLAWLPCGLFGYDREGNVYVDFVMGEESNAWKAQVEAAMNQELPLPDLVNAWVDSANGITMGVEVRVLDLNADEDPAQRFAQEMETIFQENVSLLAEAETVEQSIESPTSETIEAAPMETTDVASSARQEPYIGDLGDEAD